MTVSPRRPHDDLATSPDLAHRAESRDGTENPLPPTLFQLPNLNPAPPRQPVPATAHDQDARNRPAESSSTTNVPHPESLSNGGLERSSGSAVHSSPNSQIHSSPTLSLPTHAADRFDATANVAISPAAADAVVADGRAARSTVPGPTAESPANPPTERTSPELEMPAPETPAGRSWMETIQQHGVVVVLLLIVVATAIFTGREPSVEDSAEAMVEAIDFDQIQPGVPIPAHEHDVDTGVASSGNDPVPPTRQVESSEPDLDATIKPQEPHAVVASLDSPQVTAAPPLNATAGIEPNINPSESGQSELVQSELGQPNASPSVVPNVQSNADPQAIVAREFSAPPVDAQTVANRMDAVADKVVDVEFNPPSLESLAESLYSDPSTHRNEAGFQANRSGGAGLTSAPLLSRTPTGITDWQKFLPPLPTESSN